jgi:hypothetical protein
MIGPATARRAAISANDVDRARGLRSADYAFGFNPPYVPDRDCLAILLSRFGPPAALFIAIALLTEPK